jgi:hypothetical protein
MSGPNVKAIIGGAAASLLLLTTAIWLPWATYKSAPLAVTYRGGRLGLALVFCGSAWLVLAASSLLWDRANVYWLQLAVGVIALVVSIALALRRISEVNGIANPHPGASTTTAYGMGPVLAVAASVAMISCSVTLLSRCRGANRYKVAAL